MKEESGVSIDWDGPFHSVQTAVVCHAGTRMLYSSTTTCTCAAEKRPIALYHLLLNLWYSLVMFKYIIQHCSALDSLPNVTKLCDSNIVCCSNHVVCARQEFYTLHRGVSCKL